MLVKSLVILYSVLHFLGYLLITGLIIRAARHKKGNPRTHPIRNPRAVAHLALLTAATIEVTIVVVIGQLPA